MKNDVIICDLDGTLALRGDRSPYDYNKIGEDKLNEIVNKIIRLFYDDGYLIFIFSGREETCRTETLKWLGKNNVCYDLLEMRKEGDFRPDNIIKKEFFDKQIKDKFNVFFILDDRNKVVDMWRRELNLLCLQVNYGDF